MKLIKSLQPLSYGIYCIARRALNLITEQLQYGILLHRNCSARTLGNYERNLLHHYVVLNYTNNQLRAELSASQRSAYNFYETESLQTEFSASSRNAKLYQ